MPIVIWGSRGLTFRLDSGEFYCPQCNDDQAYDLKHVRPFFTLYFIPLFPIGAAERFVECKRCNGTFREEVLDAEPPSEEQRLFSRIWGGLQDGMSLDDAEDHMVESGMSRGQARDLLDEVAGDETWTCDRCSARYIKKVRKCRACKKG